MSIDERWQKFATKYNLSELQIASFKKYQALLCSWNEKMNLTAITDPEAIIADHFEDSLAASSLLKARHIKAIADIGSGAGFPAIPLKIMFPHLVVYLIEVSQKKVLFLQEVIAQLGLHDVQICDLDWRTFLRQTNFEIDLFCARASLQPEELIRVFKQNSPYWQALLVYWATDSWRAPSKIMPYITQQFSYVVGTKKRKLVIMCDPGE